MKTLKLGFSPCPNDTFIFHAMVHSLIDTSGHSFDTLITDVDELNTLASQGLTDITKLSFHAWLRLKASYDLLSSGAALGFGCGPLLVHKSGFINENSVIAVPGELTTAALLLRLFMPGISNPVYTRFDNIMPGIASGKYDAGVVIHEGRFVYKEYGLNLIVDLGGWWEKQTGMPIPLGCIAVKKSLGTEVKTAAESMIRKSVEYALADRTASSSFIKKHAAEMDDEVIRQHIELYVNQFSIDLGARGYEAVRILETLASEKGII